jgi:hypothetical protein
MKRTILTLGAAGVLAVSALGGAAASASTPASGGLTTHHVHFFLTPGAHSKGHSASDERQGSPPLTYHGGPIMKTEKSYAIFWDPGKLQDGTTTQGIDKKYKKLIKGYFNNVNGSDFFKIQKQYTGQGQAPSKTDYADTWIDTTPFPKNHCSYSDVGSNCVTDADIQARVIADAKAHGITTSDTKMFFVYTPENEGSCFDAGCSAPAYEYYCAYHGYADTTGGGHLVYANMPFPTVKSGNNCYYSPGGVQQFPSGDVDADAVINVTSHEQMEAITDPLLSAWWDAVGYENGDECAWNFGSTLGDGGDVDLNGHPYGLQKEGSNNQANCELSYK